MPLEAMDLKKSLLAQRIIWCTLKMMLEFSFEIKVKSWEALSL